MTKKNDEKSQKTAAPIKRRKIKIHFNEINALKQDIQGLEKQINDLEDLNKRIKNCEEAGEEAKTAWVENGLEPLPVQDDNDDFLYEAIGLTPESVTGEDTFDKTMLDLTQDQKKKLEEDTNKFIESKKTTSSMNFIERDIDRSSKLIQTYL